MFVQQQAALVVHFDHTRAVMQLHPATHGLVEQGEQSTPLHAQAEQPSTQACITHVHDPASARRFSVQARDGRTMRQCRRQQVHLPQHLQARGLQQETGTYRSRLRRTFEDLHPVAIPTKQQGQRLPGSSVANDGDIQHVAHGTPVLMAGKLRRSL